MVRDRRDGGAPAAPARSRRRDADRGGRRGGPGRAGAGRGSARRIRPAAPDPSADLGAHRGRDASSRRAGARLLRPVWRRRLRAAARRGQRHDHDRQGHIAASDLRSARVWPQKRRAVGAGADHPIGRAVPVRPAARHGWTRRGRGVGRADDRGVRLAFRSYARAPPPLRLYRAYALCQLARLYRPARGEPPARPGDGAGLALP